LTGHATKKMILNAWTQCNRLEMTQFKLLMVFAQDMQTPKCIRDLQLLFPLFEHDILPLIQVLAGESYSRGGGGGQSAAQGGQSSDNKKKCKYPQ
jgi:hypothetical protein